MIIVLAFSRHVLQLKQPKNNQQLSAIAKKWRRYFSNII